MDIFRILSACFLFLGLFIVGCQNDESCSQGSGIEITNQIEAESIRAISNASLVDINLREGSQPTVSLTAEDNIIDDIDIVFVDGAMTVDSDLDCISTDQSASAEVTTAGLINLRNSGNGDITGRVVLTDAEIVNLGNGDINIQGDDITSLTVTNTSNGDVTIAHVISQRALIGNSGNGDINIVVEGELEVAISGNGDVFYTGSPSSISATITGNGELIDNN